MRQVVGVEAVVAQVVAENFVGGEVGHLRMAFAQLLGREP